jgi:hypothetical protein
MVVICPVGIRIPTAPVSKENLVLLKNSVSVLRNRKPVNRAQDLRSNLRFGARKKHTHEEEHRG